MADMEIRISEADHTGTWIVWDVLNDGEAVVGGTAETWETAFKRANEARLAEMARVAQ